MAETVWEQGKLKAIYQPAGRRQNGEQRYRRATFDLLEWSAPGATSSDVYVVPTGVRASSDMNGSGPDVQIGQEFGYYDREVILIDLHEGSGLDDTWKSLHCFGYV